MDKTGNFIKTNYPTLYAGGDFFTAAPENEVPPDGQGVRLCLRAFVWLPSSNQRCFRQIRMLTGNEFSQEEIELAQWDDGSARREQELLEQQDLDAEDEVEDESR